MTTPAGSTFALARPKLYWAPIGSPIPSLKVRYSDTWPAPWVRIQDTATGLQVMTRAPREGVFSEERERIGSVPAASGGGGGRGRGGGGGGARRGGGGGGGGGGGRGGTSNASGTAVAFQAITFDSDFWRLTNKYSKITVAAQLEIQTMTVATGATTSGTLTFTPDDGTAAISVPVLNTDSTASAIATKIRAATFTGFTTGGTGATVTLTAATTGRQPNYTFAAGGTGVTLGVNEPTVTQMGHSGYNSNYIDRDVEFNWMLGFDGKVVEGSLFPDNTLLRGIMFKVENTQDGMDVWGYDGRDAVIDADVVLEALPADQLLSTQYVNSGVPLSAIDPKKRFMLIDTKLV